MQGYIESIKTTIPNSNKEIFIDLGGKNLILTGTNGCGKTRLITHLHEYLHKRIVLKENPKTNDLLTTIAPEFNT